MNIDVNDLKRIIAQVLQEMGGSDAPDPTPTPAPVGGGTATMPATAVGRLGLAPSGPAERGSDPKEVVIALSPASRPVTVMGSCR